MKPMHIPATLTIPHWRPVIFHALPNILEGKLIPVIVFVGLLKVVGTVPALLGALAWSVAALTRRVVRKQAASGLLVLTTLALTARTVAALATGSMFIYFLQPTVATCLVGGAFLVSVPLGRPLAERLTLDMVPLDDQTRAHPTLQRFFRHVSLWWAFTSMINFSITLWLLLNASPATFVLVKSVLGPATTTVTLLVGFIWFRSLMARTGTRVVFGERTAGLSPA
ncbi:MAG: hypothetical protein GY708_05115 [Actinomycetia bacterium]|nr:hypothetical protein [Actinomycetes bacterium]